MKKLDNFEVTPDFNMEAVEKLLEQLLKGKLTVRQAVQEIGVLHEYTLRAQSHEEIKTNQKLIEISHITLEHAIKTQHGDMQELIKAVGVRHE